MQFILDKNAGEEILRVEGERHNHLFRSRRTKKSQSLYFRNLQDLYLYTYRIENLGKKEATLKLINKELSTLQNPPKAHLMWAIIDSKSIEKVLPTLNELNLAKITFFYADFSQKNFKPDLERMDRILENSCEQCGRITKLEIEILENLHKLCERYKDFAVFDFGGESLPYALDIPLLIGAEGGFSQNEREFLKTKKTYSAKNCNILRSENAAIFATSRLI